MGVRLWRSEEGSAVLSFLISLLTWRARISVACGRLSATLGETVSFAYLLVHLVHV